MYISLIQRKLDTPGMTIGKPNFRGYIEKVVVAQCILLSFEDVSFYTYP